MNKNGFKVGKYYKHSSGKMMHIVGSCKTTKYGWRLVGECSEESYLQPVGQGKDNAENWEEINEDEWMSNFSKE